MMDDFFFRQAYNNDEDFKKFLNKCKDQSKLERKYQMLYSNIREISCLIIGAIECIEKRKDYRLAVEKLKKADSIITECEMRSTPKCVCGICPPGVME